MKVAAVAVIVLLVSGLANADEEPECPFVAEACSKSKSSKSGSTSKSSKSSSTSKTSKSSSTSKSSKGRSSKSSRVPYDLGCCEGLPPQPGLGNYCVSGGGMAVLEIRDGTFPTFNWCCPKNCELLVEECVPAPLGIGAACLEVFEPPASFFTAKTTVGDQSLGGDGVYCCPVDAFSLP